ncbi:pre-mRNA-splicing factor syf2-like isoform X1 [Orbicella faveolata]|uniref:pre-mRNA-splicing factor syf2-like isoform X1 n=1 Tax=Orbicella faveolata TaxID=48498 RepID=UPI0009E34537|nr:pre-mRNA-splicing factor syf2-like isoform X1 [Orbicella faveolata]
MASQVDHRKSSESAAMNGQASTSVVEDDDTEAGPSSSSSSSSVADKRAERMKRLRDLHLRRNEARKLNHQEVAEEDRRKKLPANWEAMQRRVEWENKEEEARKEAESRGEDYDRVKLLEMSADDADRLDRKRKKKNPDQGFSGFAAAQYRQYQRLTKQMKPNNEDYKREKEQKGEGMYPSVDDVNYGGEGKVPEAAVDRMVADLEKQIEKREKYSRRRAHQDEADIDYINERNMKFNKKLARFYDPFTSEIKQNLERGTAI